MENVESKKRTARLTYLQKNGWMDTGFGHTFTNPIYHFVFQYTGSIRLFVPSEQKGCFKENLFIGQAKSISNILGLINHYGRN